MVTLQNDLKMVPTSKLFLAKSKTKFLVKFRGVFRIGSNIYD